jgi:hypothetical protein
MAMKYTMNDNHCEACAPPTFVTTITIATTTK